MTALHPFERAHVAGLHLGQGGLGRSMAKPARRQSYDNPQDQKASLEPFHRFSHGLILRLILKICQIEDQNSLSSLVHIYIGIIFEKGFIWLPLKGFNFNKPSQSTAYLV